MSAPMFSREMWRDGTFKAAAVAAVVGGALLIAAIVGAVRVDAVEAAAPAVAIADSALRFAPAGSGTDVAAAVAKDLFADDRTAPRRRYLMPGDVEAVPQQPALRPVVLGTAISGDGDSFAICQVGNAQSKIVRAGQKIGEYTVISIERGRVTFRSPDGERISIDASKPVP